VVKRSRISSVRTGAALCAPFAFLVSLVLLVPPAGGQEADYYGEVRKGELFRIPVVIEDFTNGTPAGSGEVLFSGGQRAEDVLARDLTFTDIVQAVRERSGAPREAGPRLDVDGQPIARPVQARVRGRWSHARGGPRLAMELIDETSGRTIVECDYPLFPDGETQPDRWQIHLWADEVTRYLTGSPGCAASRIAFVRETEGGKELFLVDWDGAEEEPVTEFGSILVAPSWHPSGRRLIFTSYHQEQPSLVSFDLPGRRMVTISAAKTPTAAAYSPNGRQVAFAATTSGDAEIFVSRFDGSQARRLTMHPGIDTAPSWSPSGNRLVFTSDRGGTPQLYIMDADGSNLVPLTSGESGRWNDSPDWSSDGRRIVYVNGLDGRFDLALVGADGLGWRRLTEGGGCEDPHWAPDGRHVVFARKTGGVRNLWVIDTDSGRLRQLTASRAHTYNPAWSPVTEKRIRASGG